MDHQSVVNLLKDAGSSVCLRVSRELFPLADEHNQVRYGDSAGIPAAFSLGIGWGMIGASLQKIWKSLSIPISTKMRLMKALVWPVATYGCESWTLRKNEETRLDAFEMKGQRKILRVS